jgi:hypothetical protein
MGILQSIRERLGAAPDLPDSKVLAQALGDKLQEINTVNAEILAHEERLPLDVIQSSDGGEASGRELADLKIKRDRLSATCDALRREIAAALEREADAEKISEFQAAAEKGRECLPLAKDLIAAIVPAAEAARALLDADAEFVRAMPLKNADSYRLSGSIRSGDMVRELILRALEKPEALVGAIERRVEICRENAAAVRGSESRAEDMQGCADCGEIVPIETRKGARDGRSLCTPCFNKVSHGIAPEP